MRRPGLRWRVDIDDQRAILDFGVNSIAGPAVIGPALEYVIQHPSFRVRDLPDPLADESKLVLAGRLIREGFLTIEIQEERSRQKNKRNQPRQNRSPRLKPSMIKKPFWQPCGFCHPDCGTNEWPNSSSGPCMTPSYAETSATAHWTISS